MFQKLVRRISHSFFPRADRPWNGDATSTAPTIQLGKRRRSAEDEDDAPSSSSKAMPSPLEGSLSKKPKTDMDVDSEPPHTPVVSSTPIADPATPVAERVLHGTAEGSEVAEAVKEVTQGVQEVEIDSPKDVKTTTKEVSAQPEQSLSDISSPPATDAAQVEDNVPAAEVAAAVPLPESPSLKAVDTSNVTTAEAEEAADPETADKDADGDDDDANSLSSTPRNNAQKDDNTKVPVIDLTDDEPAAIAVAAIQS